MTYEEWLDIISSIIPNILNWFNTIINYLLTNYFVVTILGFVLFTSLFYFVYDILRDIRRKNDDFDNIK